MKIILTESQASKLKGWEVIDGKLTKTFKFKNYDNVLDFVNKVSKIAKKQNHHPDMLITYDTVKVTMFDHEENKISDRCYKFTNAVDEMMMRKDDTESKWVKCEGCGSKFTQTIHKGKKSLPICPKCGKHNK